MAFHIPSGCIKSTFEPLTFTLIDISVYRNGDAEVRTN